MSRWKREYKIKSGYFSKKKESTKDEVELKALKKELRNVTMERDILRAEFKSQTQLLVK